MRSIKINKKILARIILSLFFFSIYVFMFWYIPYLYLIVPVSHGGFWEYMKFIGQVHLCILCVAGGSALLVWTIENL